MDRLIVYGNGFAFGVKQPEHWRGNTEELAAKFHVNIVFESVADSNSATTIRVRANHKVDENTVEDLNYDMAQYKRDFPKAQFSELSVSHPEYKTFAKLVSVPGKFYEYVVYVNPGPEAKSTLSVAMSTKGRPASAEELQAFNTVLHSLAWLSAAEFNVNKR